MIRLHKNYNDLDQQRNIRYGMACLQKAGITTSTLIDNFPAALGRIKLEMDMGIIPAKHVAWDDEHPYTLAAEYLLEELLSPPFLPEKYGIPIVLPAEYVAFLALSDESDYIHGCHTPDENSAIQLLMESDQYMMKALLMGFDSSLKKIKQATHEDLALLANKRPFSLQHISQDIVPDSIWLQALKNDPSVYILLPDKLRNIDHLIMACEHNPCAFMSITSADFEFLPRFMRTSAKNYREIVKLISTQCEVQSSIYQSLNDDDFIREMSCNTRVLNINIFENRSVEVCLNVVKSHFENGIMHENIDSYLSVEVVEKCLEMGYLKPNDINYHRATELCPKYGQLVHDHGQRREYDDLPF